ncbi:MAG: Holliday junction branch migration protein RuvA [Anaerolineales bacterium]|nr:Holliday junction branch migration protein RuvA [Anaerolineales bacterium]
MIASISGKALSIEEGSVVIEVGGLGVLVHIPTNLNVNIKTGDNLFLHTYLVVRQDALTLYGFNTAEARDFFILLLGVNGVGPRLALAILSVMDPDAIRRAVFNEQPEVFGRVPGVGKRTAQKILIHLQDRIKSVEGLLPVPEVSEADREVVNALTSLGYSLVEAQTAVQSLPLDTPEDLETRLRLALQYFGK